MNVLLNVNGFEYEAHFEQRELDDIIKPLILKFQELHQRRQRRIIVFLAAPPAVGKSTFSLFLESVSKEMENAIPVQCLSLDGFHHTNEYLANHKAVIEDEERCLSEVKGMPETFDLSTFKEKLVKMKSEDVKWPIYDRNLHDVVPDQIPVHSGIVLIEGNWLLLDEPGWKELKDLSDYSIFIGSKESMLKERLINRKIRGGSTPEEAAAFYEKSDRKNIERVMKHRLKADMVLDMLPTGEKVILKEDS
ncbi:nucleoside/nucleotide kinase family protein [Anaerotalea alkaliphila]|uniref:Nucleoside/nucleotide kinase family protein n=1 Tax=Anaerotalea alkaliphila TaxID=2662126 RepID=A0A7X5HXY2_9FIRM|nr:nucleoside/nucleotide kinase family protein [Anaerotalea alkaliphila]NDL68646.1 nucleoside/nucleotide kinase family protein [Anaerotalea alkaliphila]